MAAPRTQQAHQQRVDRIAAEAAKKIAAESPVEEDVIVTVEEVPPSVGDSDRTVDDVMSPVSRAQFMDTAAGLVGASTAFTQRVFDAQLRFAARMANAVLPDAG